MSRALTDLAALRATLDTPPLGTLSGRFHSHLTVRTDISGLARLTEVARRHHAKVTVIDLDRFDDRTQRDIMTTRYHLEEAPKALGRIADTLVAFVCDLEAADLPVVRVKVEHETDPSLAVYTQAQYHEVHIKLAIDESTFESDYAWLSEQGPAFGWVPSRNPYERREGRVVQFVTLRCYDGDRTRADAAVEAARAALSQRALHILEIKRETTVLDTHRTHDAWWL